MLVHYLYLMRQVSDVLSSDAVCVLTCDLIIKKGVLHRLLISFLLQEMLHKLFSEIFQILKLGQIVAKTYLGHDVFEKVRLVAYVFRKDFVVKLFVDFIIYFFLFAVGEEAVEPYFDFVGD